jgi:hypothetical protein
MNFQPNEQVVGVDLSGVTARTLKNILTGEELAWQSALNITLPAYGFGLWAMLQ